jgi:thioredoxin reductase (NADPH)
MKDKMYDLIIIGAGPAGMSAAVYAARYKLNTLIFGEVIGGMASEAYEICNFLSYGKISGFELAHKMQQHVADLGLEIKTEKVTNINKEEKDEIFKIKTDDNSYFSKKIILATGTEKRKLNLDNEDKFLGRGISYCATCDAAFFKDKIVGVVGGSNAALTAALLLSEFAGKVYIIYRRDRFFRAEPAWTERVNKNKKIHPVFNANVVELIGKERLEAVKLDNKKELKLDGLFIEIGSSPNTELPEELGIELENGYIKTDNEQRTNVKGVFAAGDITAASLQQIIVAAAQGAVAAYSAYKEAMEG